MVTLLALFSYEAYAWGGWAHKFITYTADKHLEPEVKAKVEKYLGVVAEADAEGRTRAIDQRVAVSHLTDAGIASASDEVAALGLPVDGCALRQ